VLTLKRVAALSEEEARETLERIRWPKGPVCPHCGSIENLTRLHGAAHRAGLFLCNNCCRQFTVTLGTIFHGSHIPLRKWLMAFALLRSAKQGLSALQLGRKLEFRSYRTAWFMAHRIRVAMKREPLAGLLRGRVLGGETKIGGKRRREARAPKAKRGRATKNTPREGLSRGIGEHGPPRLLVEASMTKAIKQQAKARKPTGSRRKLSLHGLTVEDALRATMQTGRHPTRSDSARRMKGKRKEDERAAATRASRFRRPL
jgi:transposase-like protein